MIDHGRRRVIGDGRKPFRERDGDFFGFYFPILMFPLWEKNNKLAPALQTTTPSQSNSFIYKLNYLLVQCSLRQV